MPEKVNKLKSLIAVGKWNFASYIGKLSVFFTLESNLRVNPVPYIIISCLSLAS